MPAGRETSEVTPAARVDTSRKIIQADANPAPPSRK